MRFFNIQNGTENAKLEHPSGKMTLIMIQVIIISSYNLRRKPDKICLNCHFYDLLGWGGIIIFQKMMRLFS